jgi:ABC-type transport system involved in multi-copper enzyme maturation permease subunit
MNAQLRIPQLNPILIREARTRMRGARPYLILTIFLLVLILTTFGIYQYMVSQARSGTVVLSSHIGQALFKGLAFTEMFFIVLVAPILTSSAISSERERLTYDMLLATPLRPGQLLSGKLIGALSYLFLLIVASIPVFSIVLIFGGVSLRTLVLTVILLGGAALFFGTIGLFSSALIGRTVPAVILSYAIVLLICGVPLIIASIWPQFSTPPGQSPPPWLLYLNPFSAIVAVTTVVPMMPQPDLPFFSVSDPFMVIPFLSQFSTGIVRYAPEGPLLMPVYRATLLGFGLGTFILLWICSHLALPTRKWQPRWSDLGFVVVIGAIALVMWVTVEWWWIVPPVEPWLMPVDAPPIAPPMVP